MNDLAYFTLFSSIVVSSLLFCRATLFSFVVYPTILLFLLFTRCASRETTTLMHVGAVNIMES